VYRRILFGLMAAVGLASEASAALIVEVGSISLPAGGTGFVDVRISSTDDAGGDLVSIFQLELLIESISNPRRLEFVDPQPTDYISDLDYIFEGDSSFNSIVSSQVQPNDALSVGDFGTNDVTIPFGSTLLLARLQVTASTSLPPEVGDTFSITLQTANGNTFFDSSVSTPSISLLTPGTVTITDAAHAVPEPASLAIVAIGGIALLATRGRNLLRARNYGSYPPSQLVDRTSRR
jgi:hypothetical protein